MKHIRPVLYILLAVFVALAMTLSGAQANPPGQDEQPPTELSGALGTAFTYQGQLKNGGALANGNFDFRFTLFELASGTTQVPGAPVLAKNAVAVKDGQFTVQLDFGNVFTNSRLYLEIGVRPAGGSSYTTLAPRQEITPAPFARYSLSAGSAQSVPWSGITGKPAANLQRKIFVPGAAFGHANTASFTANKWGLSVASNSNPASFMTPAPADWDKTTPITVTLYFALPTNLTDSLVKWRLIAGTSNINLDAGSAGSGWDSLDTSNFEDATALTAYAAGGHFSLMKSQSWTSTWSDTYQTWYFGSGVTTNNDFSDDPIWHFGFSRGYYLTNGETYADPIIITGAEITYQTVP